MPKIRIFIKIQGIVQGVGFRPFVYNLAYLLDLKGWVNNNSEGVFIDLEGEKLIVESFINTLRNNPPPLSKIETIIIENKTLCNYKAFKINVSEKAVNRITLISPDIATCEECRKDINDPNNRRYKYPFTNCTNCGPRFTIIKSIPYDRDKTTMKKFKMCPECYDEYSNPLKRRFHAQPNACSICGPNVWLTDNKGLKIEKSDPILYAQKLLLQGKILAIKGLGGFHLVCDAKNNISLKLLRDRKLRPDKPFAVMAKDLNTALKYCVADDIEKSLLTGIRKPIVILARLKEYSLPEILAPNQNTLGVMLPYTPLHELLFNKYLDILVMTSANINGLPLEYNNDDALKNLSSIVDYFLLHDRDIFIPIDDSVVRVINGEEIMIRRARGYAPEPIKALNIKSILACGSNMKNTFCIAKEDFLFLSQHNGDLENIETFEHYKRNIDHFKGIFTFKPEYLAYDMHPGYMSSEYALNLNLPSIAVQHHHAHIVSCMVENTIDEKLIGIAFDGTGYGTDGRLWGSEFMICDRKNFKRVGHLPYIKMPGGEKAIKEPWRMVVSYLYEAFSENQIGNSNIIDKVLDNLQCNSISKADIYNIMSIMDRNINCPETSSMGRFFDAIASLIGIRNEISYEGQASIELEAIIDKNCSDYYNYSIDKINHDYIIDTIMVVKDILKDKSEGVKANIMSAKFHNTVIKFTVELAKIIRCETGLNKIALSGGVFQNVYLLENLLKELSSESFSVYSHKSIPTNDGGVSLGQIIIANNNLP